MSYSSLWGIKSDYTGWELTTYGNSWLFSPAIMGALQDKYDIQAGATGLTPIMMMSMQGVLAETNEKINNSGSTVDRICWELANQQIFFTKDKKCIADSIRQFHKQNIKQGKASSGRAPLADRFCEIAMDIERLDESVYPYFVFKNTSVDDNVEYWFNTYDEDSDSCNKISLKDWDKFLAEFVVIRDGKIERFIGNMDFEYK